MTPTKEASQYYRLMCSELEVEINAARETLDKQTQLIKMLRAEVEAYKEYFKSLGQKKDVDSPEKWKAWVERIMNASNDLGASHAARLKLEDEMKGELC